tara:strand:+ start:82 stop:399 length:318 start_codon:yes stop_codon:yes gene_type:complete
MKKKLYNNINIILGGNAKENHLMIDNADGNDWWFHLDDYPSGHCIVETDVLTPELISEAAYFVKMNSKYKSQKKIKVIYLQIKNIKKTKDIGEVILLKTPDIIIV